MSKDSEAQEKEDDEETRHGAVTLNRPHEKLPGITKRPHGQMTTADDVKRARCIRAPHHATASQRRPAEQSQRADGEHEETKIRS